MPPRMALGEGEWRAVQEVMEHYRASGEDMPYQGVFERRYCQAFTEYQGGGYADAVATGTVAVFVALAALGLPAGTEVLVSPITDPGSLSAVIMNRLVPRLMDSRPGSYNTGLEQVAQRLTPGVGAVLLVHSAGQAVADLEAIAALCAERGVALVEDCSQAHGARLNGRRVGTFGRIAAV
jgi:perosamine synthetase